MICEDVDSLLPYAIDRQLRNLEDSLSNHYRPTCGEIDMGHRSQSIYSRPIRTLNEGTPFYKSIDHLYLSCII